MNRLLIVLCLAGLAFSKDFSAKKDDARSLNPVRTSEWRFVSLDEIYTATDVPLPIPDHDGANPGEVTSQLSVPNEFEIGDVNVTVTLTHTYDRDIVIAIESPIGTIDTLFDRHGGSGDNLILCTFDDEAENPVSSGSAPFSGSFRPDYPLSIFDGQDAQGTWTLYVSDHQAADIGTLEAWSIELNPPTPFGGVLGQVLDAETNLPIPGARVQVDVRPPTLCVDNSGEFLLEDVPAGPVNVHVWHDLHQPFDTSFTLTAGDAAVVFAVLEPRDITFFNVTSTGAENIQSQDTTFKTITVAQNVALFDLDVELDINHTYIGDLDIWIQAPNGQRVHLVEHDGGNGEEDYQQTRLDDEACQALMEGSGPYTGNYRPDNPLSQFDAIETAGDWMLVVYDFYAQDEGMLNSFTLHFASEQTGIGNLPPALAGEIHFMGSYPNPFNNATTFKFSLTREADVTLSLFDVNGRLASEIGQGRFAAGEHSVNFSASHLASGLYFAQLVSGSHTLTQKTVLLK